MKKELKLTKKDEEKIYALIEKKVSEASPKELKDALEFINMIEEVEQEVRKQVSLKIKKQMIIEFPFHKDLKRFLGIVSDVCGFYSDKELKKLKKKWVKND